MVSLLIYIEKNKYGEKRTPSPFGRGCLLFMERITLSVILISHYAFALSWLIFACAAASLAIGTRYGEQDT